MKRKTSLNGAAFWVMALALLVGVATCALLHAAGRNAPPNGGAE